MTKQDKPKRMCNHPEWYSYSESKPEPIKIVYQCECGENWACPVCGWGAGNWPCSCMREGRQEELRAWYEDTSERYTGAWEALADA